MRPRPPFPEDPELVASTSFRALGTTAALLVAEPSVLASARAILVTELDAIDLAASRFREDSELTMLNRAAGRPVRVSPLLFEAIGVGLRAARLTEGAVDPSLGTALRALGYDRDFTELASRTARVSQVRVTEVAGWCAIRIDARSRTIQLPPGVELDLGATAKALAADRAAEKIHSSLGVAALVNLGGDISIAGSPWGGWRVLVTDDHADPDRGTGQSVCLRGGGLATSSTAVRRWKTTRGDRHHIVDPLTGDSAATAWRTASVAAGSCVDANIAATAAIVNGASAPRWLAAHRLPSRLVRPNGAVLRVAGWPDPR